MLTLKKIAPAIVLTLIAGAFVAYAATNAIETPIALFSTSLASKITSTQTTMTLVSGATLDGTTLASSTYSFIIDEGTASQEFVKADCTSTTCTNMQRGVSGITGTSTVSALAFLHLRGASVKITDAPYLLNLHSILTGQGGSFPFNLSYSSSTMLTASSSTQIPPASWVYSNFANTSETQNIGGNKTFTGTTTAATNHGFIQTLAPSNASDVANKAYVDAVSIAGAANASLTTKGIVQEATVAQINAGTAAGSTGAELYVNPAQLLSSIVASSTTNYATTSAQVLATSTISKLPTNDILNFFFHSTSTVVITKGTTVPGFDTQACITFNTFSGSSLYSYNYREILGNTTDGAAGQTGSKLCVSPQGAGQGTEVLIRGTVMNKSGLWKNGSVEVQYTSNAGTTYQNFTNFIWKDTSQITSISFDTASTTAGFATSTYITAY